jgi:hypothetical protein
LAEFKLPFSTNVGHLLGLGACNVTNEEIRQASRSSYCLGYRELLIEANLVQITRYCEDARRLFIPIVKTFTPEDNSRWLLRHYLAIKFVTAASLLAGSAAYAYERNLLMAVPYFNYYAVLNACRAYLLTSPRIVFEGTKTMKMNHDPILHLTADT